MEELYQILDKDRVHTKDIEEKYVTDGLGREIGHADALVFPTSTEEVAQIMSYATKHNIPVVPRGAGTNLVGSTVPKTGGIVLDVSRMNRILSIDVETMTAVVEPGVLLEDLQREVEKTGLFYPPDPGEKQATIGGNISTNAGGMRAVKYGVTRDYVRGLEVVLANGEKMEVGGHVIKDSSGLPLKHMFIGSEGTLGVITKAILRLVPKPTHSIGLLLPFADLDTGIATVISLLHGNVDPTAVEFVERSVVELGESYTGLTFPYSEGKAYIIMTLEGDSKDELKRRIKKVQDIVQRHHGLDVLLLDNLKDQNTVWTIRGCLVKAVEEVSEQIPIDIVVPINCSSDFMSYVHQIEEETGVQIVSFGHAGDGNVHLCVVRGDRDQAHWNELSHEILEKLYDKSSELGGLTSGEHGIGQSKKEYFLKVTDHINIQMMQQVKKAFDPNNLLNPKKIFL